MSFKGFSVLLFFTLFSWSSIQYVIENNNNNTNNIYKKYSTNNNITIKNSIEEINSILFLSSIQYENFNKSFVNLNLSMIGYQGKQLQNNTKLIYEIKIQQKNNNNKILVIIISLLSFTILYISYILKKNNVNKLEITLHLVIMSILPITIVGYVFYLFFKKKLG